MISDAKAWGMTIADRTRKILWGRSGNRCAICKIELVAAATASDDESVVGDECHIVSGAPAGPRYDPLYDSTLADTADNLILLCRVHHKIVDDQPTTYTAQALREVKATHERWVTERLANTYTVPGIRFRRVPGNIPRHLVRLRSGQEVFGVVEGAFAFSFDHDEPRSQDEADLLAGFFQEAQDWGDLSGELEAGERVRAGYAMNEMVTSVESGGFWIFGARETQQVEGGGAPPSPWPVAILRVLRADNPQIVALGPTEAGTAPAG